MRDNYYIYHDGSFLWPYEVTQGKKGYAKLYRSVGVSQTLRGAKRLIKRDKFQAKKEDPTPVWTEDGDWG